MASKIVVITGSRGRIGRIVARALLDSGYTIRSVVRSREAALGLPAGTVPYIGSLSDSKMLANAFDGADAVLHLAAIVSEYKYTTEQILDTNVVGTRSVVEACNSGGVSQLIFSSSIDVYGRQRKGVLTEESELRPSDKYGYSKMLAEQVIREEAGRLRYTIFRLATAYGPGFESSFFKVLGLIKEGKAYLMGKGDNSLAIIHVSDVAQAVALALGKGRESANKIYNLSDGLNQTQKELFALAAAALHVPKPERQINRIIMNIMIKSKNIDSDELRFLTSDRVIDISRARKELGFSPKVDSRKGIEEVARMFAERAVHVSATVAGR